MTLQDRIDYFDYVFGLLLDTNSRNEKEAIVADLDVSFVEDFNYIIECLNGVHKFGYKFYYTTPTINTNIYNLTVKQALELLQTPMKQQDLSRDNIELYVSLFTPWIDFFEPIVNRTLKLGIGNSLLEKSDLAPMLAKKFEGDVKYDKDGYYITEKLDGNRCIAHYENGKWNFTSRNGKQMHVNFNMSGMDTDLIYDGEVLSPEQTFLSCAITTKIKDNIDTKFNYKEDMFNKTSGLINQHTENKKLVYNVFDVIDNSTYRERREYLDDLRLKFAHTTYNDNIRIVPVLKHFKDYTELDETWNMLDDVTSMGGEGLMINLGSASYIQKRTDKLLKLKKVYSMDMKVEGLAWGTGKYEGMIGAIIASATTSDGKQISCSVGTGLSDEQRKLWANHRDLIVGKIIEVSYFSLSQSKEQKGTNYYSLRFPRLKFVREDKNETSEY